MTGTSSSTFSTEKALQHDHSIEIFTPPHPPRPLSPSPPHLHRPGPNLPSDIYLSEDERKNYLLLCLPLYEAALKGDWQAAQRIIGKCPQVINVSITKNNETALHIASSTKHVHFVEKLVNLMKPEDLELQNKNWNTALCLAAAAGTVKIVEIMVKQKPNLLKIRGNNNMSPLLMAALFGHKDMVSYLYSKTDDMKGEDWTDTDRIILLNACISAKLYDVALTLLNQHKKKLALATDKNALHVLARNPSEFAGKRQPVFWRVLNKMLPGLSIGPGEKKCQALEIVQVIWGEIVEQRDDDIWDIIRGPQETIRVRESNHPNAKYVDKKVHQSRLLFVAAALGNTQFLIELLRLCPELIWKIDDYERTIFHVAVLNRQESVYNLLYEIGSIKDLVTTFRDTSGNNILHLAAMMPEQDRLHIVSGVALQMQRELLWFKEVETMVHPSLREMKNKQGKTPQALFSAQHAELMEKGESWMKETASQCMVVAALIATIMFAAAFTLPGGNDQASGHPMFKHESAFIVFVITDAVSLFSSSASILMFLAILTARYAERDFLASLPIKLMIGLLALFISITTMMVAFSASFFLVYTKGGEMAGTTSSRSSADMELQPHHSINIPTPPQPNYPSSIYVSEREKYQAICLPLYEAALKGDWQAAQGIIGKSPEAINVSITMYHDTALHVASSTKHTHFVEELVKLMQPEDLELQNYHLNTALCIAAAAGNVKIAEIMVKKNPNLLRKRGANNMSPLSLAALFRRNDMVSCLYSKTNNMTDDEWTSMDRVMLLQAFVSANLFDVALKLLHHHKKELAQATDKNALHVLARNPSVLDETSQPLFGRLLNTILPGPRVRFDEKKCQALEIVRIIWREIVKLEQDDMWNIIRGPSETGDQQLLFVAAALGNTKLLIELLRLSPELIWKKDDNDHTIFHVAVLHRQDSVYNLLYEIGSGKDIITSSRDSNNNSILHLAAMKPEKGRLHVVTGVALQMQREILWFKEVETVVHPSLREMKNKQGKTPQDLFTEQHAELMDKGEIWMKDTAAQCMVVAALIATMMFAAAFTLPGGTNGDNGQPIFKNRSAFMVFIITDAVSLFSSSASILVFLAILTARYAESDFLVSLPVKLLIGLVTLFVSIATMMIAFSASFFLVYTKGVKWVPYLICVLAGVPVVLFAGLQYPLFNFVVRSTYNSRFLFKPTKHILY